MTRRPPSKSAVARISMGPLVLSLAVVMLNVPRCLAQDATDWQVKAGGRMSFDVASVKPSKVPNVVIVGPNQAPPRPPTFSLAPDDIKPRGGRFYASFPLKTFIEFAYKLAPFQTADAFANAPKWLSTDRFEIEAEAQGNPTMDQMRLMMQTLLSRAYCFSACLGSQTTRGRLVTCDLTRPAVLPSPPEMEFSAPIRVFRSSIARPTDTPIYDSTSTSRCLLQDSGPRWRLLFPAAAVAGRRAVTTNAPQLGALPWRRNARGVSRLTTAPSARRCFSARGAVCGPTARSFWPLPLTFSAATRPGSAPAAAVPCRRRN